MGRPLGTRFIPGIESEKRKPSPMLNSALSLPQARRVYAQGVVPRAAH
jgi:hypothetical protein